MKETPTAPLFPVRATEEGPSHPRWAPDSPLCLSKQQWEDPPNFPTYHEAGRPLHTHPRLPGVHTGHMQPHLDGLGLSACVNREPLEITGDPNGEAARTCRF